MVLLSDTRTNAGVDNIACFKKTFNYEQAGERVVSIMTAGNLSVTQNVILQIEENILAAKTNPDNHDRPESIFETSTIVQVATMIGDMLQASSAKVAQKMSQNSDAAKATIIMAGQRKGYKPHLFLIYSEGNFIEAHDDTPFLQIGEHKYGKPILDSVIRYKTPIDDGIKAALLSMNSTLRSNLSVGMPLDLTIIHDGACKIESHRRIEADDKKFMKMSENWAQNLRDSLEEISL